MEFLKKILHQERNEPLHARFAKLPLPGEVAGEEHGDCAEEDGGAGQAGLLLRGVLLLQ